MKVGVDKRNLLPLPFLPSHQRRGVCLGNFSFNIKWGEGLKMKLVSPSPVFFKG